ncbi:MAG: hypothetical protein AAGJ87_12075, partial [Pseudomonadota bacterium]
AFPHLVRIASQKDGSSAIQILTLAAAIASAEDDPSAFLTKETEAPYFDALDKALALFATLFVEQKPQARVEFRYWLGALAAFKGHSAMARQMFGLDGLVSAYLTKDFDYPLDDGFIRDVMNNG